MSALCSKPTLRWLILVLVAVALLVWLSGRMAAGNARDVAEIQTNPQGERAARTMVITLADGRIYPVNYLREGNLVFMGIDGRWWRVFVDGDPSAQMLIQGQRLSGRARVVLDDQAYVDEIFARLRPKAPSWLPAWLNGKLVVITLDAMPNETT